MSNDSELDSKLQNTVGIARQQTVGDLLRRSAAHYPTKTALIQNDIAWTYHEFNEACDRLVAGLQKLGVVPGDRLAILSRNSYAFVALRYAVARAGAVLVPINFMLNVREVQFILRSSGATILAVGADLAACGEAAHRNTSVKSLISLPAEGSNTQVSNSISFDDLLANPLSNDAPLLDSRMLAQIVYTSGTESLPKGAMLTHEALVWQYASCVIEAEIATPDVLLHALPLCHCAQLDACLGPAVYVAATNIVAAQPRPDVILPLIEKHKISSFFAPPSIWISLLRSPLFDATDTSSLRKGYYGASIMPVEVLREIQVRFPNMRLWNLYGQTEIAPVATVLKPEDQIRKAGSAGKPVLNVETRIVNDQMKDVAIGEVGEIVHRSPQLLTGYFDDPEKSAAAFDGGWFHSGDLGTIDAEGYITVVDRKKDMIKSGGENVASREVEEVIYGAPGVSEVVVIGLPDPYWIEAVTAIVVAKQGASVSEDMIKAHCREHLAHFKVPKQVIFVEDFPKTASGKVLKRDLRLRYAH